jgi:sugar lactone lactonase YvrE
VIRYIAPDDGPVSTLAGPPPFQLGSQPEHGHANGALTSARFIQPRGLALTGNGLLIVSDNTGCVRKINLETQVVEALCGSQATRGGTSEGKGVAAAFDEPAGVVADNDGNIYCCDQDNNRVVSITPDGEMKTLVRDQNRPNAIIMDKEGSLLWYARVTHSLSHAC